MNKFAVITIHKGYEEDLIKTYNSVCRQKEPPDLYLLIGQNLGFLNYLRKKPFIKIINNNSKDKSLWDAMNIGLNLTKDYFIIFLNSGDIFFNNKSINVIKKKINNGVKNCLIFKTNLIYKTTLFSVKKYFFYTKKYSPHPSFVRPKIKKKLFLFDSNIKLAADSLWIKKNIKEFGIKKYFTTVSTHYLGGISSNPNYHTITHQFKLSIKEGLLELLKFLIKNISMKRIYYYKFIYFYKYKISYFQNEK
jgi:hypothetical protein